MLDKKMKEAIKLVIKNKEWHPVALEIYNDIMQAGKGMKKEKGKSTAGVKIG